VGLMEEMLEEARLASEQEAVVGDLAAETSVAVVEVVVVVLTGGFQEALGRLGSSEAVLREVREADSPLVLVDHRGHLGLLAAFLVPNSRLVCPREEAASRQALVRC